MEPLERAAAKERQSTLNNIETASLNFGEAIDKHKGETLETVARATGVSRETLRKQAAVMLCRGG